jgi:hypothetical protein
MAFRPVAEIQALVCKRCWDDVFNTFACQRVCLGERDAAMEYTVSVQQVLDSKDIGCSFCSHLWTYLQKQPETSDKNVMYTARLCKPDFELIRPHGMNAYYFTLECSEHSERIRTYSSWAARVSACTSANDNAALYVTARPRQTDVSPTSTQAQVRQWISECQTHDNCGPQEDMSLPSCVIDTAPEYGPDTPRILDSTGIRGQYVCKPIANTSFYVTTPPAVTADEPFRIVQGHEADIDSAP